MKYLVIVLGLMFSVTCLAADYTVEKSDNNYEVTFYQEKTAKDGSTVLIKDYTRNYTVERIDREITNLENRLAESTEEINAKVERLKKIKAEMTKEVIE